MSGYKEVEEHGEEMSFLRILVVQGKMMGVVQGKSNLGVVCLFLLR